MLAPAPRLPAALPPTLARGQERCGLHVLFGSALLRELVSKKAYKSVSQADRKSFQNNEKVFLLHGEIKHLTQTKTCLGLFLPYSKTLSLKHTTSLW